MKKLFCGIFCFVFALSAVAQHNGYSLSSAGIRIYNASAQVLNEIDNIPNNEQRLVQIGSDISQADFDNICTKLKWIKRFSVENSNGEIANLSSLKKLKQLEQFQLKNGSADEPISLLPLGEVQSLTSVVVISTEISGYESLALLPNLETVSFENSPLASLEFLANATQLKKLNLAGTRHTFANYDTLAKLNDLTLLDVSGNAQATSESLDVFSDVPTLTKVNVSNCQNLKSLGFLYSSASRLQEFSAVGCSSIGNFDMLIRANKLKKIDLSNSSAKNVAFLKNKVNVKELRLANTQVASIEELTPSVNIERLDLSHTKVVDLTPLAGMTKLKRLNISHTQVTDVSPLAGCVSLTDFDCSVTQIESIEGMENCRKLSKINIGNTLITNLRPFYSAEKIVSIIVDETVPEVHLIALRNHSKLIVIDKIKVAQSLEPATETEQKPAEE